MTIMKTLSVLGAAGCALLHGQAALAAGDFINPDWANSAWYAAGSVGQGRATIDRERLQRSLTANGAAITSFSTDERDLGYKLAIGRQLNRYFAVEAGYHDLGEFGFSAATTQNGALRGTAAFRGVALDLVAQLPLSERISLLGRIGMHYTKASTHFRGNRLAAVTDPDSSERKAHPKVGLGLEYKFSEALALRGEAERYRVNDAVGNRGDVDLYSVSLVYKFGRPVAALPVRAPDVLPAPAPAPVAPPPPAPVPPAPAPVAVSEKVSFAAEALFDFDKSIVKPQGKLALDDLLARLQGMNTEVMVTDGHTDAIGSDDYNQRLSLRRAEAVKAYMVSKGIEPARVYVEGKGEGQPVADNASAEGRARNRRVTVEVVGTRPVIK